MQLLIEILPVQAGFPRCSTDVAVVASQAFEDEVALEVLACGAEALADERGAFHFRTGVQLGR